MVSTARQEVGEKEEKTVLGERSERRGMQSREVAGRSANVAGGGSRLTRSRVEAGRTPDAGAPEFNGGLALKETRVSVSSQKKGVKITPRDLLGP